MTNQEWTKTVEDSLIERHDLKRWLISELEDDMEVERDEDEEGHVSYYWADKYDGESRIDTIAEKIAMDYVNQFGLHPDEEGEVPPSVENAINAGVGMLAEKIYNDIYDECYEKALDNLPNPNERDD